MRKLSMTQCRAWLVSTGVIALLFGLEFPDPRLSGEPSPLPMVIAAGEMPDQRQAQTEKNADESAKENADESGKTGNKSGTQAGDKLSVPKDEANVPNDAKGIDQPPGAHPGNEN